MRATIWGCRGSLAAPGRETLRYGGNTACVEVRLNDGSLVILDAGTGIRPLGLKVQAEQPREVHLLLSHLHLDHLVGLGFFPPLFTNGVDIHVWGPRSPLDTLEARISRYLSPPLFPIHLSDAQSRLQLHDVPDGSWSIGGATLLADHVSHSGPTLGFRIEESGASLAYIPDHEPAMGIDLANMEPEWISGYALMAGVDVLLHDAQYTQDEYLQRIGWGHSSIEQVVTLARRSGVKQLILFHHDPKHSDADLELMEAHAWRLWGESGKRPILAHEGMKLDLPPRVM